MSKQITSLWRSRSGLVVFGLTHRCCPSLSSWLQPGRTRSWSSAHSTRRSMRQSPPPADPCSGTFWWQLRYSRPRRLHGSFASAGWSCVCEWNKYVPKKSRETRWLACESQRSIGETDLKKWLFPHRIRSPWWSWTGLVTAAPFTQVLQAEVKEPLRRERGSQATATGCVRCCNLKPVCYIFKSEQLLFLPIKNTCSWRSHVVLITKGELVGGTQATRLSPPGPKLLLS